MLVFIVIKSLQSMSSSVEYIIMKYFDYKCWNLENIYLNKWIIALKFKNLLKYM